METRATQVNRFPASLTVSMGTKGGHINYENDFNHPLSFGVNWKSDHDADLVASGEALLRLIAAAPDLLNGCNALLGLVQSIANRDDISNELRVILKNPNHAWISEARNAIAKAADSLLIAGASARTPA